MEELASVTLARTRRWKDWTDATLSVPLRLDCGRNVLRITCLDQTSLYLNQLGLSAPGKNDIVVEAASFTGEGGGKAQTVVSDEGGYFINWDATGHWLEWTIEDAADGEYDAFLRYATLCESPREMRVNGEAAKGLESFTMPLTGDWRSWVEARLPACVRLKQGRNVLRMTSLGGGGLTLNGIRLVHPGGRELIVDAVSFSGQGGGKVRAVAPSRHGSLYMWNAGGHWLEWTIENARAGDYHMVLRYATRARSPREVRLSGRVVQGLESLTLQPTGGWSAWQEAELPRAVTLKQGRSILRMTSLGGGRLNLDEMRLDAVAHQ